MKYLLAFIFTIVTWVLCGCIAFVDTSRAEKYTQITDEVMKSFETSIILGPIALIARLIIDLINWIEKPRSRFSKFVRFLLELSKKH